MTAEASVDVLLAISQHSILWMGRILNQLVGGLSQLVQEFAIHSRGPLCRWFQHPGGIMVHGENRGWGYVLINSGNHIESPAQGKQLQTQFDFNSGVRMGYKGGINLGASSPQP